MSARCSPRNGTKARVTITTAPPTRRAVAAIPTLDVLRQPWHRLSATGEFVTGGSYGRLKVHHDSVVYDFNNMPDRVYPSSPQVQQDAVSLLCYHCGVSVSMNYQHAGNNDGSGAHTEDVPDALRHFGYMHAQMIYMTTVGESTWMQMLRDELDNGRPVLYRGISTGGGHAFVCDGYRDSQNKFHINWGWSGYQDGYFTLDNLNGYSTGQGGVINIYPSGLAPSQSTYYVSTDGTGDGSSWEMASSNLNDAIGLMKFRNEGSVWVKEGVYYGDTTGSVAFPLYSGVALYGGFVGNESFISDRTAGHPSILDGGNARVFFSTQGGGNKLINIDGFTLRHGRSDKVAIGRVSDNVKLFNCEITENVADDDGVILFISGHNIEYCRIHHNEAPSSQIIQMESGNMNCCRVENNTALAAIWSSGGSAGSCLIAHNSGDGADATLGGSFVTTSSATKDADCWCRTRQKSGTVSSGTTTQLSRDWTPTSILVPSTTKGLWWRGTAICYSPLRAREPTHLVSHCVRLHAD